MLVVLNWYACHHFIIVRTDMCDNEGQFPLWNSGKRFLRNNLTSLDLNHSFFSKLLLWQRSGKMSEI